MGWGSFKILLLDVFHLHNHCPEQRVIAPATSLQKNVSKYIYIPVSADSQRGPVLGVTCVRAQSLRTIAGTSNNGDR